MQGRVLENRVAPPDHVQGLVDKLKESNIDFNMEAADEAHDEEEEVGDDDEDYEYEEYEYEEGEYEEEEVDDEGDEDSIDVEDELGLDFR